MPLGQNFGLLWRRDGVWAGRACFGHTSIPIETAAARFAAGESVLSLASDLGLRVDVVEAGLRAVVYGAFSDERGRLRGELRAPVRSHFERLIPLLSRGGRCG